MIRKINKYFKEPKRKTNYAKYFIHARIPIIWNSFLKETEKTIYCTLTLNVNSRKEDIWIWRGTEFLLNIDREWNNRLNGKNIDFDIFRPKASSIKLNFFTFHISLLYISLYIYPLYIDIDR